MDGAPDMGWNYDSSDGQCGHITGEWDGTDPTSERTGGDCRQTRATAKIISWSNDDEN
ncbi:MAG: hypothetical protein ACOCY7_04310 [Halodesulfurarchaeum sp.]